MSNVTLTEVPLITQEHSKQAKRFTIQNDLSITQCSDDHDKDAKSKQESFWNGNEDEWKDRVHGCAATLLVKKTQTLIRTAACVEEPYVLSIAKMNMNGNGNGNGHESESPLSCIEIDLSHLDASIMGTIIKTMVFRRDLLTDDDEEHDGIAMDTTESVPVIEIMLVDSEANILSIPLDSHTLQPLPSATHTCTISILSTQNIHPHTRYTLTSTQIVPLDSNRLVIAITPFVLCLNLTTQRVASWSKESCHYNRRKSLSGVFKSAKGILVGRSNDAEEEFMDDLDRASIMASTAALCVFDKVDEYTGVDISAKVVCSLHSDGTVRMWTCALSSQQFTYPKKMRVLYGVDAVNGGNDMPLPHLWSSSSDSLLINGHSYIGNGNGGSVEFVVAVGIRVAENVGVDRTSSPFHLTALSGEFTASVDSVETTTMVIPKEVDSMKAMDFVRLDVNTGTWELRALYSSIPERNLNESGFLYASFSHAPPRKAMVAVYKSQSSEPLFVKSSNTFETFVEDEREKIIYESNLMSRNEFLLGEKGEDEDISVTLRRIDGWYLQRMFRSGSVQTVGLDKATDGTIRRALRQVVPPLCIDDNFQRDISGSSIEVETLVIINKWAKFDETRSSVDGRRRAPSQVSAGSSARDMAPTSSVYSEFYNASAQRSQTPEIREDSDDEMESAETSVGERKIQQNHSRWKKLLLAVNYEETKLLSPIGFSVMQPSTSNLVLRPGITSTLVLQEAAGGSARSDKLDSIMISMLERIENAEASNNREILSWLESRVWQTISKAKLLYMDDANALIFHVNDAISNLAVDGWDRVYSKLLIILNTMSQEEVKAWLSTPLPSCLLSEPPVVGGGTGFSVEKSRTGAASVIIPNASRLSKQYIAGCQRLALARYICINGIEANGNALFNAEQERVSLVAYLHTVATSWTCAQILSSTSKYEDGPEAPPVFAKRLRTSSFSKDPKKISMLSMYLSRILKSHDSSPIPVSIVPSIISLSSAFVRVAIETSEEIYPELAIVPQDFPEDAARISLRLLSPLVAFPDNDPSSKNRNIKAADCLLSEVFALCKTNNLSLQKSTEALEHASILLKSVPSVISDPGSMGIFLETLGNLPNHWSAESSEVYDNAVIETIQHIFGASSVTVNSDDILILSRMEQMKKLVLPWVVVSKEKKINTIQMISESLGQITEDPSKVLCHAASVMLAVSKLVERVQVLEKHGAMLNFPTLRGSFAKVLISAVNDVIETVQNHANPQDYIHIVEYPALWSALFRNALQGHCWEDAFEACLSNPIKERQITNFQRLVIAMTDAGALGVLLDKMIFFIVNGHDSNSDMDLYELATETLVEASQRASTQHFGDSSVAAVDYRGCLYALHAAYGNWRRSCQAIDFLGALTLRRIPVPDDAGDDSISSTPMEKEVNDGIMDELVLSAVSAAQLIQLVDNPSLRYIVSGELAASPAVIEVDLAEDDRTREGRSPDLAMDVEDGSASRSSRLYSHKDLLLRAKRLIALQTLQRDAFSPENILGILNASDTSIIDALPRLGYYDHAIAFSHCKQENKKGTKPRGRDVFVDAVSHMLCKCLAPVATSLSRSLVDDVDIESEGNIKSRPTMHQLRLLSGDGRLSRSRDSWQEGEATAMVERGASALELLRLYTETYAAEDNTIALDVAKTLLDLDDGRAALPVWLTNLIIGRSASDNNGLFAKNGGNPTALLNLYIKNGLYIEACSLVSTVLLGEESERQKAATSRLPEKGNIDFVPYEAIDNLWNLIETGLKTSIDPIQKGKLLKARNVMEISLEKHFQLMQVSEQGMLSARALNSR